MTLLALLASYPTHCPHCSSEQDIIVWGTGWMCRDCNFEWITSSRNQEPISCEIKDRRQFHSKETFNHS